MDEKKFHSKKRIAVSHHHFSIDSSDNATSSASVWQAIERQTMKLRNKKKIMRKLSNAGIELVLHGHLHETNSYRRKNIQFLNSGGSVLGNNFGKLSLTEISVNSAGISHKMTLVDNNETVFENSDSSISSIPSYAINTKEICLN